MTQSLAALRKSAPDAQIIILVPFGQFLVKELKESVEIQKKTGDTKIAVIDLGPAVAKSLQGKDGIMGGLHPNDRGHANFAAKIIPQMMQILNSASK
jgi:hypothetical protein